MACRAIIQTGQLSIADPSSGYVKSLASSMIMIIMHDACQWFDEERMKDEEIGITVILIIGGSVAPKRGDRSVERN